MLSTQFQETIYFPLQGSKLWEVDCLCSGEYDAGEPPCYHSPGMPPTITVYEIDVTGARIERWEGQGWDEIDGEILRALEAIVWAKYDCGEISDEMEGKILELIQEEG